jgi:hypothetical protein
MFPAVSYTKWRYNCSVNSRGYLLDIDAANKVKLFIVPSLTPLGHMKMGILLLGIQLGSILD